MPYKNFNTARVRDPKDFKQDSFRTIKGGDHVFPKAGLVSIPEEIRVISGQLKEVDNGEKRAPMELLFPIDKYEDEAKVRIWLEDENIEMIAYYPAGEGKMDDEQERALDDINTEPTNEMVEEAEKGLAWREEFNRGGTAVGVARARDIKNKKSLSLKTVKRMFSFFSRHEVDKKAEGFRQGEKGYPSNGRIAWALWGGDPGFAWAKRKVQEIKKEEERNIYLIMGCSCSGKSTYIRNNASPSDLVFDFDKVHQALSISKTHEHNSIIKDYVFEVRDTIFNKIKRDNNITAWIINSSPLKEVRKKLVEELDAKVIYIQRDKEECLKTAENERPAEWKEYINNYFEKFDGFDDDEDIEIITVKENKKEYNNFKNKNMERRIFANEFRVVDDKKNKTKKIIGYASVFNSESENLGGFFETISRSAFDTVIENNQDVRALFNHNPDYVLGRTTAGTLSLSVDERGLKYEIDTPDTNFAKDLVVSMERGDITQSSFGFTIAEGGDEWNEDEEGRTIRTINQVDTLFDISPVTYPAYTEASVAVRAYEVYKENKEKTENKEKKANSYQRNLRELKLKMIK